MKQVILVINPGSTSTKVALFNQETLLVDETIRHTAEELAQFDKIVDQKEFRRQHIMHFLEENNYSIKDLIAVVGRGGLLKPIPGGTYLVNEAMLDDLIQERYNTHASNLGAILAYDVAQLAGVKAYIVDPVVVEEMTSIAKLSGLKGMNRRSVSHALNQKAVARMCLQKENKEYIKSNVIVAHLGGGISVGAHRQGRMIDVVNGLDGEGPYSPERTGALPLHDFAKKIIDESLKLKEVKKILAGRGGIYSYLNEIDLRQVLLRIEDGDQEAKLYLDGMCYQVAKAIGEMATVLKGQVELIILTGGGTYSDYIVTQIKEAVEWIAPVETVPGEMEMEALNAGVLRVLEGVEEVKSYSTTHTL